MSLTRLCAWADKTVVCLLMDRTTALESEQAAGERSEQVSLAVGILNLNTPAPGAKGPCVHVEGAYTLPVLGPWEDTITKDGWPGSTISSMVFGMGPDSCLP